MLVAGCGLWPAAETKTDPPRVIQGVIDLSAWDFPVQGPVSLDGEWDFYWRRFVPPFGDGEPGLGIPAPSRMPVPGVWNGRRIGGRSIDGKGYATYRIRVRLGPDPTGLALHILDAATACTVWIDGRQVYQAGTPGPSPERSRPRFRPAVVVLPPLAGEVELLVHLSNFSHRQGGLWEPIRLGTPAQLHRLRERRIAFDMVLFGGLVLMGLYHLAIFGLRRVDKAPLFFGLGCLTLMLRPLTTGERYLLQFWDRLPFEWLSKLEYWGFYLTAGCFALFVGAFFRQEADRHIIRGVAAVSALFSLLVLVSPLAIYSYTTPVFEVFTVASLAYGVLVAGRALGRAKSGADIFLFGFLCFCATVINDILVAREVIQSTYIAPFGMLVFVLSQAFIISLRTTDLFAVIESQQNRLKASEEKYRTLVDTAADAIFIVQDGVLRFANPRTATLFGVGSDQLPGMRPESFVHLDDRRTVAARIGKAAAEGTRVTAEPFRLQKRAGTTTWVSLSAVETRWDDRPATLCFLRDISARKQLETQLYRARKMEALGTLAGGMARHVHRFIADVVHYTERVMDELPPASAHQRDLQEVIDRSAEVKALVRQIEIFSRKAPLELRPLKIAEAVRDALMRIQATLPPNIRLHTDIGAPEALVMANAQQLGEVVGNLTANAIEAMPDSGRLNVTLQKVHIAADAPPTGSRLLPGCYVRLTVTDTGSGIAQDIQDRVFDPFFTTRPDRNGMGLAAVMSIVKGHGGDIELVSTPRMGTTVHVFLPAISDCLAGRLCGKQAEDA